MPLRVALIGTGKVAVANHLPGLQYCRDAALTALCDPNPAALAEAARTTGVTRTYEDPFVLLRDEPVDAVIIATPNRVHKDITVAAVESGRHVLCEKPLALTVADAEAMLEAATRAGVRHMTAFTYRFVPAMRFMKHLVDQGTVGEPWHFRAQRFQDWGRRDLGWRQLQAEAGTGELGDMLSHRIDFAHSLVGPIVQVQAAMHQIWAERSDAAGNGRASDTEDWVAVLARFARGTTGVFESAKTATGYGEGVPSRDYCEINGSNGAVIYELSDPLRVRVSGPGVYQAIDVPREFRTVPGSPRDGDHDPYQGFRYDQDFEFVQAIQEGRDCEPSFADGVRVQRVMDAIVKAAAEGTTVTVG